MVKTRSQITRSETTDTAIVERYSDNGSKNRMPDVLSRGQINDFDKGDQLGRRTNYG